MKPTLLFTFLCSGLIFAQDKDKPNTPAADPSKTKIELFQSRKGEVIIKSSQQVHNVRYWLEGLSAGEYSRGGGGIVEAWELIDAKSGAKKYGVKISIHKKGRASETVFFDIDEIDAVIKGIDYILGYEAGKTKFKEWQVDFKSKAEFRVSVFSTFDSEEGAHSTNYAIDAGGTGHVWPNKIELENLKQSFERAKGLLGE